MRNKRKSYDNDFRLSNYLKNHKVGLISYMILYLLFALRTLVTTILYAQVISQITLGNFRQAFIFLIIAISLEILSHIIILIVSQIFDVLTINIAGEINRDLIKHCFRISSSSYSSSNTGSFVNKILDEPESVIRNLAFAFEIIVDVVSGVIMIAYLIYLNIYIGILMIVFIFIISIIENYRTKHRSKYRKLRNKQIDILTSITTEMVRGEKDTKSMSLENKLTQTMSSKYNDYKDVSFKLDLTDNYYRLAIRSVSTLCFAISIALGIYFVDLGLITLATFMIIYSNSGNSRDFAWNLGNINNYISYAKISWDRMKELFDKEKYQLDHFGDVQLDQIKGEIEFKNVDFSYVDKQTDQNDSKKTQKKKSKNKKQSEQKEQPIYNKTQVLDQINLKIKPNTTVAFVGVSGSGKSTMLSLISKLYDVSGGELLIDGHNINTLSKNTIRNNFTLVNQYPYIFDLSIKENLLLVNHNASEQDLIDSLKKASLWEFVEKLPKQLDTVVGESGVKLSGGQKQRLAIARAFLKNNKILMLDESTSSLDNISQDYVRKTIDNMKGSSTIIIVAHRLSTIKNVDTIYFLEKGKIVDFGNFNYLLKHNQTFKLLFESENIVQSLNQNNNGDDEIVITNDNE